MMSQYLRLISVELDQDSIGIFVQNQSVRKKRGSRENGRQVYKNKKYLFSFNFFAFWPFHCYRFRIMTDTGHLGHMNLPCIIQQKYMIEI